MMMFFCFSAIPHSVTRKRMLTLASVYNMSQENHVSCCIGSNFKLWHEQTAAELITFLLASAVLCVYSSFSIVGMLTSKSKMVNTSMLTFTVNMLTC